MKIKLISLILLFTISLVACKDKDELNVQDTVKVSYEESFEIITNPERGFYTHQQYATDDVNSLSELFVKNARSNGLSLILTIYYMKDFRDKLISEEYLQRIKNNMQAIRDGGCKTVLRFAYTSSESQKPWDAPWSLTEQHIEQLTPILEEYVDVICVLEAGFVGVWGEWYYTDNYIFQPAEDEFAARREVLDALLTALPKDRMICVRYPKAKLFTFGLEYTDTISIDRAYDKSDISRLAFHNDCFLADQDDRGTFGGNRNHRKYWQWETKYVAMGGETCAPSSYAECANALQQFENYHWSYINNDYNKTVLSGWRANGCMDEIRRRLGYRFVLTEGEFSKKAEQGNPFTIKLELKNVGWAAPFNPRNVEIIFISKNNQDKKYKIQLNNDPRFWFAGETVTIEAEMGLPEEMELGVYEIYLNLPDPKPLLKDRWEYSIQFANKEMWNTDTGYNKLHSIELIKGEKNNNFSGKFIESF